MDIYTKLYNVKKAGITLQRNVKRFNYKYATLDQIQNKLGDILEKEKLLVLHFIQDNKLITEIRDIESDGVITSEIELKTDKPQDKGSEITYFRRYNLLCLLDLEVEDDDGKKAQDSFNEKNTKEIKWYNDVDKNLETWRNLIIEKKATPQGIIDKIEQDGFKINNANKEKILNLF